MYQEYWQLETKPFEPSSDPRFFYPSEAHQGALLKLRYAIENHRGAALLCGPSGAGKTMLVNMLQHQVAEGFQPFVHLVFPQMSSRDLLTYIAEQLGAPTEDPPRYTIEESVRRLEFFLTENTRQNRHAVLAIDEAHLLEDIGVLETLRLLLNFELASRPGLTLLLVGQPAILSTLSRNVGLDERLGVKTLLRAFSQDESYSYVQQRMQAAGATREIFVPAALEALHYFSQGIARQINRLADLALLVGFAEERTELGAEQIESVSQELLAVAPE